MPTPALSSRLFRWMAQAAVTFAPPPSLLATLQEKWAQGERGTPMKLNKLLLKLPS